MISEKRPVQIDRKEQRKNAKFFIGVYTENNESPIGYLLDLTSLGMRLKSLTALENNANFEFKIELPIEIIDSTTIKLKAKSIWCKNVPDSRYHETGFEILDCPPTEAEKLRHLLNSDLFSADAEKLHISLSMIEA